MYSQNEEEKYILEAVGDTPGMFLDIGAYDGITRSNTLSLVERGWSGILIEPSCYGFQRLLEYHGDNKRLILLQALASPFQQFSLTQFWNSCGDGVSTAHALHYEKWKNRASFNRPCLVPALPLLYIAQCLVYPRKLNFVSIDAEGESPELFLKFPSDYLPDVFCVEYDNEIEAILEQAEQWGYKSIYMSGENVVLVR